ncbi:acetyl-CoA carboxylase [Paucilactobacillus kaifaensis]|uniref:acetyl-CoA carboxylase n=1 Tax=Paucilactobacillus kaifaensis TaxID=2559921 RepID=UPI0010F8CDE5|nr:acetyl-CoA carboxylase [Paucilactobacillus kaifaensis]
MTESVKQASELILKRLSAGFAPKLNHRYQLMVVDNVYDQTYNFFLDIQHKRNRRRSIPLHSITKYELQFLEQVIKQIKANTKLTIVYINFHEQRWPLSQRIIYGRTYDDNKQRRS